jgi:PPM family protein phosphatase
MGALPITAFAFKSVTGIRRPSNQDRHIVDQELGFVLLADGVAGRPAGERASQVAIEAAALQLRLVLAKGHCRDVPTAQKLLDDAFRFANLAVHRCAEKEPALANMASTLVGAVFIDGHAVLANVGDSRIYRLRHAFLKQVTDDHVLYREGLACLSREERAAIRPLQLLTRAVGYSDSVEPASCVEPLASGDVFLLCSDGLSDVLERHKMAEVLARTSDLDHACKALVDAALAAGAEDDVTVVLVRPHLNGGRVECQGGADP